jgi:TonB family protein
MRTGETGMLKIIRWGLLTLVLAGTASGAEGGFDRPLQLQLDIDAQGHLAKVEAPVETPPPVVDQLTKAANSWTYTAPQRDGHGLSVRTWAYLILHVAPAPGEGFRVGITLVANGPGVDQRFVPIYPDEGLARKIEAFIVVSMTVKPDGTLDDAKFERSEVSVGNDRIFRKAILASMSTWRAHPELIDGKPIATRVQVPFLFDARAAGSTTVSPFIERVQNEIAARHDGKGADSMRTLDSPAGVKDPQAH